jgi:serine/threonine protein kinase
VAKLKDMAFETLTNSYKAISVLGQGGSGTVYEVTDNHSNIYALKLLSADVISTDKVKRFKNEMNFLYKNRHTNIVPVLDYNYISVKNAKLPFYVMPRYRATLRMLITHGIQPDNVLPYFGQILSGLETLHFKGGWHRDLKPENILHDEQNDQLLIADFGTAHFAEEDLYTSIETKPTSRLANFEYAAPEQRRKDREVNHKADIYALGLILNEMFTGDVLHGVGHQTIAAVAPNYSYLDEIVNSMVQQTADRRPNSIDAIKQQLIAHRNDFIQRQKISQLERTVIPTSEVDDILIADPVQITDFDYNDGILVFQLNHNVTAQWIDSFRNMSGFTYSYGSHPRDFSFRGNTASVGASVTDSPIIAQRFKDYLTYANRDYKRTQEEAVRDRERKMRQELQAQLDREKKRLADREAVLRSIKI